MDETLTSTVLRSGWIIVGAGRIGSALRDMGQGQDLLVRRGEPIPPAAATTPEVMAHAPVVLATRNDDLAAIVDATPPERRADLVFLQNGMLEPWLEQRGLRKSTQALIYFAVAKKGDKPVDGNIQGSVGATGDDLAAEAAAGGGPTPLTRGLTAVCGPHAAEFARRLWSAGLTCRILDRTAFRQAMLEKLVWICAYMLVGVVHGGVTVGEVATKHREEVDALAAELLRAGATASGIEIEGLVEASGTAMSDILTRLAAYSACVSEYPTALKEVAWRNGFFLGLSAAARKGGASDPCPLHSSLMALVG